MLLNQFYSEEGEKLWLKGKKKSSTQTNQVTQWSFIPTQHSLQVYIKTD